MKYDELLARKALTIPPVGISSPPELHGGLFDYQSAITRWALRRGRACLFLDTGLGKSRCSIEWARVVSAHTGKPVLILTPLAVAPQFVTEGASIDVTVTHAKVAADISPGVNVTNYDKLSHFEDVEFGGVVLDESSILKDFNGKTKQALVDRFAETRFRLCASATPAPNDHTELGNHAEFLGVMTRTEMLSMFFVHDGASTQDWRLKGHAESDFWKWIASWAMAIKSPEDIGFDGSRHHLPPLTIEQITVGTSTNKGGMLLGYEASTLTEQRAARRESLEDRVSACAEIVNASTDQWVVWCELNDESTALAKAIHGSVEVRGSDSNEHKEKAVIDFVSGKTRVLVTKPSICGMGLNMQNCHDSAFVGLGYSWEQYYQAIRRFYRFGQKNPVHIRVITGASEGRVVETIKRKQADADAMSVGMISHMAETMRAEICALTKTQDGYEPRERMIIPSWL